MALSEAVSSSFLPAVVPPPPEPSLPRVWQKFRFLSDPFALLSDTRKECGDLFVLHLPGLGPLVFLCSARLLAEVHKMPEEQMTAGAIRNKMMGFLTGSRASLSIDGPEYLERRRIMTPYFSGRNILAYVDTIRASTDEMVADWPRSQSFTLKSYFNEITLKTICRMLYGPLEDPRNQKLLLLSGQFLEAFRSTAVHVPLLRWNLGRLSPWGRFLAIRRELRDAIISATTRETENADDLLSGFMASSLADKDSSEKRRELRDIVAQEALSLLVGGSETTATSLVWTMAGLLSERQVLARLRQELGEVLGDRPIEAGDLRSLPYLDAVIHEGIRYQSVAPFAGPRQATQDFELDGYHIKKGSVLVQGLSEVGRDPRLFPHLERFDPANFFERDVKTKDWLPFGGGARVCPGMGLAKLEMMVVLATLVQRVDLELDGGSLAPVRKGLTFMPKNDLRVRMRL